MIKNNYSIVELMKEMKVIHLEELLSRNELGFINKFGMVHTDKIEVRLIMESENKAHQVYNEVKYNPKYSSKYSVRTDSASTQSLYVSGSSTLFDYFGTKEPNILTLSRELGMIFKIEYQQEYSGIIFNGEVMYGELLARNTHIEVNMDLPELTLGGLRKIAHKIEEFDILLTRFYNYQTQVIY